MKVEYIGMKGDNIVGTGSVAQRLLSANMDVSALRTNDTLLKDEWELLDTAVVQVARERLMGVQDLFSRGLDFPVRNPLGVTVVQHQTASDMIAAEVSMDGVTRQAFDRQLFALVNTPLPIIHHDFQLTLRHLMASRDSGQPLDTSMAQVASRLVSERLEEILFNGVTARDLVGFGTNTAQIFGYTNRTGRNTVSLGTAWDAPETGANILIDVIAMITAAHNDNMFGPYMLYVPKLYWIRLMDDFKAESDKTILQRIKEIPGIIDVRPADKLTANNVVLVQMTSDNVDIAVGFLNTLLEWESQGGMVINFKVMAIAVPRIKLDYDGRSGVVHLS
jgi:uncharacterized linocin/CFP29 family protein